MDNEKRKEVNVSFSEKEDFLAYLCNISKNNK